MAAPISTATDFALGRQTVKGTAITALYTLRMKESMLNPIFEEVNVGAEHGIANSSRPTLVKSSTRRTGYMAKVAGAGFLYPHVLPLALLGIGFKDTVTNATASGWVTATSYDAGDFVTASTVYYCAIQTHTSSATDQPGVGANWEDYWDLRVPHTHTFTIADRDEAAYLTAYQSVDEGSAMFERIARDVRFSTVGLTGNIKGALIGFDGLGLYVADAAGTETFTDEVDELIVATDGSMTATIGGTSLVSIIRGISVQIENPLYTQEARLFNPERADLPQLGIGIAGGMTGIDVDETLFNKLYRNNATGTALSLVIPEMLLTFKFESVVNMGYASVPYSVQFSFPATSARMTGYGASGRNLIRCGISFTMKDLSAATEPVTVTIVNDQKATYYTPA